MRREDIHDELKDIAFDFFYWFSRFEFALKENKLLKRNDIGENAEPGWDAFIERYAGDFKHSKQTRELLELNPKRQKVGPNSAVEWKEVDMGDCRSDLCRVVRLLKTVRNNLFHGGKHGADGWDDPDRTKKLLSNGKVILDLLAAMADFEADYTQCY
ncbi:MAG: hypothetical protein CVV07_10430 [Gammaproteobacteria bacterium HGW-Gammaproteobacteria-11]|nr:MAG: hypothetical protein CVV07_10430 [Gammaproteobacteria bacterium HGW-Gammaproteobacteria-11]